LPQLPPVAAYVQPAGDEFVICTGGTSGAYFRVGAEIAGFVEAYAMQPNSGMNISDASPIPGGGTYGCLAKLATGEADAAIIQSDGRALLPAVGPDLMAALDLAGPVLTEEVLTFCARTNGYDDFGGMAERRDTTITVAGTKVSGTNVMLNVITGFDNDFLNPTYIYKDSLADALDEVANNEADCAVAVMDINSPAVAEAAAKYGDRVRLVGTWDRNFRDLEYRGEQVYGWRAIPEDTAGVSALLSWDGNGRGMWSPEVVTETAVVVYREDMPDNYAELLKAAVAQVAKLKSDVQD
jgi:TRAP-type uncharacterized transport system substrate-binding protein